MEKEKAPSYFLQGLIYNVPSHLMKGELNVAYRSVLNHLYTTIIDDYKCQNNQHPLFGETEEQWDLDNAKETIIALVEQWDSWYE